MALLGGSLAAPALAQDNQQPVKIGVLTDMAGMYKDIMGPGSVLAAQMAVEDFGGKVLGRPIEVIFRRPPDQAGCRGCDCAQLVRQ
jgi:branched-chain amino acid transport system substrate-binding protein